jgi:hypothetical protein
MIRRDTRPGAAHAAQEIDNKRKWATKGLRLVVLHMEPRDAHEAQETSNSDRYI